MLTQHLRLIENERLEQLEDIKAISRACAATRDMIVALNLRRKGMRAGAGELMPLSDYEEDLLHKASVSCCRAVIDLTNARAAVLRAYASDEYQQTGEED